MRIEQINVEDIGPLRSCHLALGQFNLIYGRNERGKSLLVEFLIRAMFRNHNGWHLRPLQSRGQVLVRGLNGDGPTTFTPDSSRKLEDYWEEQFEGLPPRLSRLLIVNGAEVGLDVTAPGGVTKQVLKELLAGQSVIDLIKNKIQKTVQEASIGDGIIDGARRGELKDRLNTIQRQKRLQLLLEDVDQHYSGGKRANLRRELDEIDAQLVEMKQAKHHRAWQLNREIMQLDAQLSRLPKQELEDLSLAVRSYLKDESELKRKQQRLEELAESSDNYRWLEQALPAYEQREEVHKLRTKNQWLIAATGAAALALILVFAGASALGALLIVIAALLAAKYIWNLREEVRHAVAIDEMARLAGEYEDRFGETLSGLPLLRQRLKNLEAEHYERETLLEQVRKDQQGLDEHRVQIDGELRVLATEEVAPEEWLGTLAALRQEHERLLAKKQNAESELNRLNVAPVDYREEPAAVPFSQAELDSLEERRQTRVSDLQDANQALERLKQDICRETDDDISINWEQLLRRFERRLEETREEYRTQTARILGQILLCHVLDEMRTHEDEKLHRRLQSASIAEPLRAVTGRYEGVRLSGDHLQVVDAYGEFPLASLSSGAQEQVLLALRLGLASSMLREKTLFLLLDDAFQYSDWERRQNLIEQMVMLAQKGWQITYFTMDDHLRDLFDAAGRQCFGENFRRIELDRLAD